jgi:acyl carrier protein
MTNLDANFDANLNEVKATLIDVLSLGDAGQRLNADSALLGSLPELDSMAVVSLIGALEERFGIAIDDDDISASTFETLGSLAAFVAEKRAE